MGTAHLVGFIAPHFLSMFYIFPFDEAFHFSVLHLFCGNPEEFAVQVLFPVASQGAIDRENITAATIITRKTNLFMLILLQ